jgi:hypothetical protein
MWSSRLKESHNLLSISQVDNKVAVFTVNVKGGTREGEIIFRDYYDSGDKKS